METKLTQDGSEWVIWEWGEDPTRPYWQVIGRFDSEQEAIACQKFLESGGTMGEWIAAQPPPPPITIDWDNPIIVE